LAVNYPSANADGKNKNIKVSKRFISWNSL
jgi:hypothetical protein